jgi:hypothetical protein
MADGGSVHVVGQHRHRPHHCVQRADVPESAVRLFEVGLEQEGDVTVGLVTLGHPVGQVPQPGGLLLGPPFLDPGHQMLGQFGVAAHQPGVQ